MKPSNSSTPGNASQDSQDAILANAKDFLNGGLTLLFEKDASSRTIKLAIVSIQTAVELMAKFRLVKDIGINSITPGGGNIPSGPLMEAARKGEFHTIGYSECLKEIRKIEGINEADEELIRRLQQLRNALVHFAAEIDIVDVRNSTAWLLIRVLAMFAAGQDRDIGEWQTHRSFLDADTFSSLINFEPYRAESVDAASDNLDSEDVFRCWNCKEDALSVRSSGTYFCYCCGLTAYVEVAAYADCALCGAIQGVFYDPLNITNDHYRGQCLHCNTLVWVWKCRECEGTLATKDVIDHTPCKFCSEPN